MVCPALAASAWRLRSSRKPTCRSGTVMTRGSISQRGGGSFIKPWGWLCHDRAMTEIELKFQVPPARRDAVAAAVAGRVPRRRSTAAAGGLLRHRGARPRARRAIALRLRREGPRWVQTLKAASGDALLRHEHNVVRPGRSAVPPALDPALHDGTPAGRAPARTARHAARCAAALPVPHRRAPQRAHAARAWRGAGAGLRPRRHPWPASVRCRCANWRSSCCAATPAGAAGDRAQPGCCATACGWTRAARPSAARCWRAGRTARRRARPKAVTLAA